MKKFFKGFVCLLVSSTFSMGLLAQNKTVSGKVTDETGQAISGASVFVKGTTTGVTTNPSGEFSLSVPENAKLLRISSVGHDAKDVEIPASGNIIAFLARADNKMEEVVVIGYGTQKRSVLSGAISSVKAKDFEKVPNSTIGTMLQGRVSGLQIATNDGQPGSASTIRVRGITSIGNNDPLWVVDNVVVDNGGINFINQSDIESIEVLKDAASAAIYGTRAAAGVILITTKKGKSGKLTVNYNGFVGSSAPAKRLQLLNAPEYAALMNERSLNGGGPVVYPDISAFGKGTDWQDAIFNTSAFRQNHELSISGGGEKSTFYISAGIKELDGIVTSDISKYSRQSVRINSNHKVFSFLTFGQTLGYAHAKSTGLGNTNSEYGGPLSSAINLDPLTPVVETDPAVIGLPPYNNASIIKDANGNPYGISNYVGQEMTNPVAYTKTRLGGYNWSDDIVGNMFLELNLAKKFKVRSTLGGKIAYWGSQGFTPLFFLSPTVKVEENNYSKTTNKAFNWNIENTVTYSDKINDHSFDILLGQGAYVENVNGSGASTVTLYNLPVNNWEDASFNFDIPQTDRTSGSSDLISHKLSSLFARVNYNFRDKYLVTGVVRRDGSTRFGQNNKYGYFPGGSVGWVANKEAFWPENNVVRTLKVRGSYGVNGSDAYDVGGIRDFLYLSTVAGGYNYALGSGGAVITGYAPRTLDNPDLRWERTSQLDIGFDANLFRSFDLTVDWFKKKTTGMLRPVNIPGYVGVTNNPVQNIATMENTGIEVELGYRKNIGKVNLSLKGNFSYIKNTMVYVDADNKFIGGDASFQSMGQVTRTEVGHAYNEFFGYQTNGIFQNWAEIANYKGTDGGPIQPDAQPGDFKWVDLDGNGTINESDRTFLGSNLPKYVFGFTANVEFQGFDLMVFAQGGAGNKIFQGLRRLDIGTANYQTKALSRWTGEGTSNDFPRLTSNDVNQNFSKMSDFYLEKGDYLRLKVISLGYSLPQNIIKKIGASRVRVYISGENLLTLTKYTGYDPEIGGTVFGIDKGVYPQARSIIGGVQLQF